MKKHMKRNFERLNGFFNYAHETFQNDAHLCGQSNEYYSEFQDHLKRCTKNENTLNNFMSGLPDNVQGVIEPDDFQRVIIKEENKYNELHDLFTSFIAAVKDECVMNVHYFSFTGLPDLILRRNYTRE